MLVSESAVWEDTVRGCEMQRPTWMMRGILGLLGGLGIGVAMAQAAVISPVNTTSPFAPIIEPAVTVSIFQDNVDVTATWLPEPGQTVQIVVNGLASPTINLVSPTAANPIAPTPSLTTSAYPGVCTNFGSDTDPDFTLVGNQLTPTDCGGMAVILVNNTHTFILPQDSNFDGIPDILAAQYCPAATPNCLEPGADPDSDGLATFDEIVRGFIVSTADPTPGVIISEPLNQKHIRTNPLPGSSKDFFVHLVNPQCTTSPTSLSLLGRRPGETHVIYPTIPNTTLFDNLNNLGAHVHLLGFTPGATHGTTDQWVDNFVSFSSAGVFTCNPSCDDTSTDRQINANAVYPILDTVAGNTKQRGIRVIECPVGGTGAFGSAIVGTPNKANSISRRPGNAFLYTQRIVNQFTDPTLVNNVPKGLIPKGLGRQLRDGTYGVDGKETIRRELGAPCAVTDPRCINDNILISRAILYYLAMEVVHTLNLHLAVLNPPESPNLTPHVASASITAQALVQKIDTATASQGGFNTLYIPSLLIGSDCCGKIQTTGKLP